jgi:hypothetical protein
MPRELLLNTWPKSERRCNIGDCPAFSLTGQDWHGIIESSKVVVAEGMEEAVKRYGVPVGTCKVNRREVVVNSQCSVSDEDFVTYFEDLGGEK